MADVSQVGNALADMIAASIYPDGDESEPATGRQTRIFQGWPAPDQLLSDMANGFVNVSIYPRNDEKQLSHLLQDWTELGVQAPTITATVSGSSITIGGVNSQIQQTIAVIIGGNSWVYQVMPDDSVISIATALGAMVGGIVSESIVTVSGGSITARVGTKGSLIKELRRQSRTFQVTVWAGCFDARDDASIFVDSALAENYRFCLPDGSVAMLRYLISIQDDGKQQAGIYRRDMLYQVEYATTKTILSSTITIPYFTMPDQQLAEAL